jgi:hypothetical protein
MELVTLNRIYSVVTPFLTNLIYNGQCVAGEALPPSLGSPSLFVLYPPFWKGGGTAMQHTKMPQV